MDGSIPVPLDPLPPPEADDKRLWIGNLDSRLTEFHLVKILKKFGTIKKFDFLFHKFGPLKGHPRGYCFVTYETREQAEKCVEKLNCKMVLSKPLSVKWAHTVHNEDPPMKNLPLVSGSQKESKPGSIKSQISAIEAKLKAMEKDKDEDLAMVLTSTPAHEKVNMMHKAKPYSKPSTKTSTFRR